MLTDWQVVLSVVATVLVAVSLYVRLSLLQQAQDRSIRDLECTVEHLALLARDRAANPPGTGPRSNPEPPTIQFR